MTAGIQWFEDSGSRQATIKRLGKKDKSTVDVKYKCLGTFDDGAVHGKANAFFSQNRFYSVLGKTFLVDSYDVTHLGGDAWEVVAHYESLGLESDDPEPLKRSRQFDTSGGTAHWTHATGETKYGDGPDYGGAIHVDDNEVKGVDIVVPALQWTETYDVPAGVINAAYIKTVAQLTGCVNSVVFRTFAAGEVLFMGCSGSQQWDEEKGDGPWNLTYKFVASPNAGQGQTWPAIKIGSIENIEKKGHEYLWVRYETAEQSGFLKKQAKAVYVNKIYREANFSGLGIGTT